MSTEQKQVQIFRHRGFLSADTGETVMIFGDGPEPTNADGSAMKKLWDHDHEQHSIVRPHVEPTPTT